MSMEFGQWSEWNVWDDLSWDLLQHDPHSKLKDYVSVLNQVYKQEPALHDNDFDPSGFQWNDCNDNSGVVSFVRRNKDGGEHIVVVCNFSPVERSNYRIGVPEHCFYEELLNSDAVEFWGSGKGNLGGKHSDEWAYHGQGYSIELCLPPLSTLMLKPKCSLPESD
ncbi:MAG: alpha amylase C-terminal domain-containing protein, partial [Cyanobacteria bacterium J06555_12]